MTPPVPEDLDAFWNEAAQEAAGLPLDCHRTFRNDYELPGFTVETISFRSSSGIPLHGWFAYPPGARRLPAFLWLPPYGRESVLPNQYGTREGFASLSFNFHGEGAFHQEKYTSSRGYFAEGADSPETWIFRRMAIDAMLAARILQAQVEVAETQVGASGMSQGGGMAIWLGAWSPVVQAVCADMPFLGSIEQETLEKAYRYPLKELAEYMEEIPLGPERVMNTIPYFDTATQASRCRVPTQVSLGTKDPAARPHQVRSIYEALPGTKKLISYEAGHDWTPEMVDNNRNWFLENLR